MGYFDGNTVSALWELAQHFAMSDNFFNTTFGPSTPGALNLVSGQTHGAAPKELTADGEKLVVQGSVISDPDPEFDDCSSGPVVRMEGRNVGDLMNEKGVSWGWFEGGFRDCKQAHKGPFGKLKKDYIPHHQPFQYYRSTSNPKHVPPASIAEIGHDGAANHQYDLSDFWAAADSGALPSVSFVKAPAYQDGHAGYSDPLTEQAFLVDLLNRLQKLPEWKGTAVLITYDDSDGWYDHVSPPIVSRSAVAGVDALSAPGACGAPEPGAYPGRCGYGPRLPLLAVSPWARENFVDHSVTDQASILRFIEDNWKLGRLGDQSFDEKAGTLERLFDFERKTPAPILILKD
jgi:phospholipase C